MSFISSRIKKLIEKIVIKICFYATLCFNFLIYCLSIYTLFTYNGGIDEPKIYGEITTISMAQNVFLKSILLNYLWGIIFSFPLLWSYFFIKRINLNAILIQLLPILIVVGCSLFQLI